MLVRKDYFEILLNYTDNNILQKLLNMFRLSLTFSLKENQVKARQNASLIPIINCIVVYHCCLYYIKNQTLDFGIS
jgi:hypothetical protein